MAIVLNVILIADSLFGKGVQAGDIEIVIKICRNLSSGLNSISGLPYAFGGNTYSVVTNVIP
ncbi:MAG: hypothetical protein ACK5LM_04590 [Lactovum sp.]